MVDMRDKGMCPEELDSKGKREETKQGKKAVRSACKRKNQVCQLSTLSVKLFNEVKLAY